ncbi:hypothetical protein [Candidatus Coxiella mudrowiae]|uniref:hypothetical protein n=1 Tax=Candidatus Coxiella mudrowiae TaxID=2054173 RepID=UPI000C28AA46|nr:hypothetical protein [Candidatus Coxiella mudrowiae]
MICHGIKTSIAQNDSSIPKSVLASVFAGSLKSPITIAFLGTGDTAVLRLTGIKLADFKGTTDNENEIWEKTLSNYSGSLD